MSGEAAGRAPMMNLREVCERYATLADRFGAPVALVAFGLDAEETEHLFSALDEDYHISRFLHFSRAEGQSYRISGEPVTHVLIDLSVRSLL
jgi:hypothetical protein